jgi:uncharacterized membrane protein YbhN (UPF0104 family)
VIVITPCDASSSASSKWPRVIAGVVAITAILVDTKSQAREVRAGRRHQFEISRYRLELDRRGNIIRVIAQTCGQVVDIERCRICLSHGGTILHRG